MQRLIVNLYSEIFFHTLSTRAEHPMKCTVRTFLLSFVLLLAGIQAHAQRSKIQFKDRLGDSIILKDISEKPEFQKRPPIRKYDFSGGLMIATDGYGILLTGTRAFGFDQAGYGNEEKYYNSHVVQLELSERLHPKEFRNITYANFLGMLVFQNDNAYIYGKANNFYMAKLTYGQRRLFGGRGEPNSPLIQFYYAGGLSVGFLKPYYLSLLDGRTIKYDSTTRFDFLSRENIAGKAAFTKGFSEIETLFGINVKGGIHFDMAKNPKRVSAIDVGVSCDYYFSPVLQMADIKERSFFANLYLSYQFGKRW